MTTGADESPSVGPVVGYEAGLEALGLAGLKGERLERSRICTWVPKAEKAHHHGKGWRKHVYRHPRIPAFLQEVVLLHDHKV